jgi:hypothetical protein
MNFIQRPKAKTSMTYDTKIIPAILISQEALNKMFIYVDECKDEIGWLGTASFDEESNIYTIHNVYLFKQQVHATTTEITPQGLEEFATELLQQEDGMEIWNNIRMWGHSHVNMGISPSGQDDKQMREFGQIGQDWFIRLIANKKGEMKVDLYHYKNGMYFTDVAWEILDEVSENEEAEELRLKIAQLEAYYKQSMAQLSGALEIETKAQITAIKPEIVKEMGEKVKKLGGYNKTTTFPTTTGTGGGKGAVVSPHYLENPFGNSYGRNMGYGYSTWTAKAPSEHEMKLFEDCIPKYIKDEFYANKKKQDELKERKEVEERKPYESFIENKQAVYTFLSMNDLRILSHCNNIADMREELAEFGYFQVSMEDCRLIWEVVQAEQDLFEHQYGRFDYR